MCFPSTHENYISQNEGEDWVGFKSVLILEAHGGHNELESSLALITDRNTQKWHHSINCDIVAGLLCYPPIPIHPALDIISEIQPRLQKADSLTLYSLGMHCFNFLKV